MNMEISLKEIIDKEIQKLLEIGDLTTANKYKKDYRTKYFDKYIFKTKSNTAYVVTFQKKLTSNEIDVMFWPKDEMVEDDTFLTNKNELLEVVVSVGKILLDYFKKNKHLEYITFTGIPKDETEYKVLSSTQREKIYVYLLNKQGLRNEKRNHEVLVYNPYFGK